ncbi:uncharacterized protein [Palaemon carinicauda]|uniref:uncharacterized protein isoform X4 n=1 Tax=Palaemon carinicauda TaxID=392227 RepID=UPI0035B667BE
MTSSYVTAMTLLAIIPGGRRPLQQDPMHLGGSSCGTGMKWQFWRCGIGLTRPESTPITKSCTKKLKPSTETQKLKSSRTGRNYSLSLSAISNGIESEPTITSIATIEPASPIIEELQPIPAGFIISWKSDVTFRQEKIYSSLY